MRCALYIRVSSDEQRRKGFSLPEQRNTLYKYAEEKGYTIVDLYADEGVSASKDPQRRHEFQRMMSDVTMGKIDIIVFIKLDRWFRAVRDYYLTQEILDRHGVKWECALEDYDTTTRTGKLNLNIKLTIAEDEAANTSERVKFILNAKAQNKEPVTGNQPFGYMIKKIDGVKRIVKDPQTQAECEDMFNYFFKTASAYKTAQYINSTYGRTHAENTVARRLKNPAYTGEYKGIADYRPAYITHDQHTQILQILSRKTRPRKGQKIYLFAGLIKCPDCGRTLVSCTSNKITLGYRCRLHYVNTCGYNSMVPEKYIEEYLIKNISPAIERYMISFNERAEKIKKINPRKLEERLERLNNVYIMGNISEADYQTQASKLKAEISDLKAESSISCPIPQDSLKLLSDKRFPTLYENLSRDSKRALWQSIISRIEIKPKSTLIKSISFIG